VIYTRAMELCLTCMTDNWQWLYVISGRMCHMHHVRYFIEKCVVRTELTCVVMHSKNMA